MTTEPEEVKVLQLAISNKFRIISIQRDTACKDSDLEMECWKASWTIASMCFSTFLCASHTTHHHHSPCIGILQTTADSSPPISFFIQQSDIIHSVNPSLCCPFHGWDNWLIPLCFHELLQFYRPLHLHQSNCKWKLYVM